MHKRGVLGIGASRQLFGQERGQAAVLFGLLLVSLFGMVAIAIDGGNLYTLRRHMQSAADLAALAGAEQLYVGTAADAISTASDYASRNGFAEAQVHVPPVSGPHQNDGEYVEVDINRNSPTFFAGILGFSQINVQARALARSGHDVPPYALLALSKTASPGIYFGGSNQVKVNNAGIMSNSGMGPSIRQSSASGWVDSDGPVNAVGTIEGNFTAPQVRSGVLPYPDPLANMQPPSFGCPTCDAPTTRNATQIHPNTLVIPSSGGPLPGSVHAGQANNHTFGPGVYWGGIHISGGNYTMAPGIYVFAGGGFAMSGGSLTGSGLFFYNTNDPRPDPPGGVYGGATGNFGPITFNTNQTVDLSASHVPLYDGMPANVLIFQDRNATDGGDGMSIQANGNMNLYGTIYIPTNSISIAGGGASGVAHGMIIVNTATFSGGSATGVTYDPNWAVVGPGATLVE